MLSGKKAFRSSLYNEKGGAFRCICQNCIQIRDAPIGNELLLTVELIALLKLLKYLTGFNIRGRDFSLEKNYIKELTKYIEYHGTNRDN